MTAQKLATLIAQKEGKKSQARIGDIREIIKIIQILLKEEVLAFEQGGKTEVMETLLSKANSAIKKGKKNAK